MLLTSLIYRQGARHNAEHNTGDAPIHHETVSAGRGGEDGGIAAPAKGKNSHICAVNANPVTLAKNLQRAEQGKGSTVDIIRRVDQGRSADTASRAERRGSQVNVSYATGISTAYNASRAVRGARS